jgi:nucleoside-diphosphate-sugar epimerase
VKVFVAGASGAIGRPLVRQLLAVGHEVTGMTRREERAEEIRAAGAEAVVCDAYDAAALEAAMREAAPDVVAHMLTAIPKEVDWKADEPLGETNRVRTEGTRWFYGPGTSYASDGAQAGEVRKRRLPIVGKGDGAFSFIHVEDAATAVLAALENGAPGIYNIVDDEPAPMRDWVPVYAKALGAKKPRRVPVWLAKLVAGRALAANAASLRGASNAKAKRELGWQPRYRSWRQGFREALG